MADLHPAIAALAPLLGTWVGRGAGEYPTIEPFEYTEEATFAHVGKPFLSYTHRTRSTEGAPMHAETGFLRMPAPDRVEWMLAHLTGITELEEGTVTLADGTIALELRATSIGRSTSAKEVAALGRSLRVTGDTLNYTVRMGAVGHPLQHHLAATLHRSTT